VLTFEPIKMPFGGLDSCSSDEPCDRWVKIKRIRSLLTAMRDHMTPMQPFAKLLWILVINSF